MLTITNFCHTLKNLADALHDVDCEITEVELVMQIIRQLPPSYQSIVNVITHKTPFPSFLEAKNMLLLHETRESASDTTDEPQPSPTQSALYTQPVRAQKRSNKNKNNGRGANKGGSGTANHFVSPSSFTGTPSGQCNVQAHFGSTAPPGILGPAPATLSPLQPLPMPQGYGYPPMLAPTFLPPFQPHLPQQPDPQQLPPPPAVGQQPQQLTLPSHAAADSPFPSPAALFGQSYATPPSWPSPYYSP